MSKKCRECGQEVEEGWEYCGVTKRGNTYHNTYQITRSDGYRYDIYAAQGMVDFDGVEFEEWPGIWYGIINAWVMPNSGGFREHPSDVGYYRKATPKIMRFRK